ncbi:hypothetical protein AAG570_011920 [Ranatra chinensis]|uniref:GIY-YIG domain-containing protein n=1 Tax=Ranatra chinensis TaxID=642074 RepID=A0ABD0YZM4_9HEMI
MVSKRRNMFYEAGERVVEELDNQSVVTFIPEDLREVRKERWIVDISDRECLAIATTGNDPKSILGRSLSSVYDIDIQNYICPKPDQKVLDCSGVYKLQCNTCDLVYIGQTGRRLSDRYKEHLAAFKLNKLTSNYATHLINSNHEPVIMFVGEGVKERVKSLGEKLDTKKGAETHGSYFTQRPLKAPSPGIPPEETCKNLPGIFSGPTITHGHIAPVIRSLGYDLIKGEILHYFPDATLFTGYRRSCGVQHTHEIGDRLGVSANTLL